MFQIIGLLFNTIFFGPIVNLLILIYKLLLMASIPGALGFAIMLLTILIRVAIWPLTSSQVKSTQKMVSLKPQLDELKRKHKDDKAGLQAAQMVLYKEHGVNPAAGCLPSLIQLPIFIALYQSILSFVPNTSAGTHGLERINSVLYNSWLHLSSAPNANFFGLNLATKPSDFMHQGYFLLLIPLLTGAFTFVQSKMMLPRAVKVYKGDKPKEVKEKAEVEDTMAAVQGQMTYLMPVMIGYFAYQFPAGLAIYWNTFTIMGIIQQYQVSGWGGLSDLLGKLWKKN